MTLPSSPSPIAAVLDAARRREPTQEQLDAMERSLLAAAAAGTVAGASALVAGRIGTWVGMLKIGVAVVVPAAVAGVVWHTTQRTPAPPPERPRAVAAEGSARPQKLALRPVPEPPMASARPEEAPRPRAAPRLSASAAWPVPSEVELVSRAQRTLASSPAEALALTDECARRYASGSMREENEVIAISALARLGRTDEARARAENFASRYPTSGYLRRIETEIGDAP